MKLGGCALEQGSRDAARLRGRPKLLDEGACLGCGRRFGARDGREHRSRQRQGNDRTTA